jgi:hypothetical protein
MNANDDPFDDINKLKLPQSLLESCSKTPAKIQKRRKNFIQIPIWWWERLVGCPSHHTYHVALFLLHLNWRSHGRPFKLSNGMLDYDGVSRQTKWRAICRLEKLGLITIITRIKKSPIIRVHLEPP